MSITIKAARINKGLTQKQACEKLGIAPSTLSSYEKGRSFPDVTVIRKMEALYELSYDDLIFLPSVYGFTEEKSERP